MDGIVAWSSSPGKRDRYLDVYNRISLCIRWPSNQQTKTDEKIMKRNGSKILFAFLAFVLSVSFLPAISANTPKAGSMCNKKGVTKTFKGKDFKCVKRSGKLVWIKAKTAVEEKLDATGISPEKGSETSNQGFGVIPEFQDLQVKMTGETTATLEFKASGYKSYRVSVVLVSDPDGKEISSLPVKNEFAATVQVAVRDLECGRSNYYEVRATVFSELDGRGNSRVGGGRISSTGACALVDTYKEPSRKSKSVEFCKIEEVSLIRKRISESSQEGFPIESIAGFPKTKSRVSDKGIMRFIAIPIDWSDFPGETNFADHWRKQFATFTEWVKTVTSGNLQVDITIHNEWIRIPGSSATYKVPFSEASPQSGDFWMKVLPTIDPVIDFTNYQYVIFILPKEQKIVSESIQELYPGGAIKDYPPKEGKLLAYLGTGAYFENWNVEQWSYFAHEIGHLVDFAHGGEARNPGPMSGYDILFSQDGPSRTLSGWWRFLADWLEPGQIFCDDVENFQELDISLSPLDSPLEGIKVAILRVSPTRALIIESRRFTKFDNEKRNALFQKELVKNDWNGALVYEYDATLGHSENFFVPVASNTALSEYNWDGRTRYIVKENESVEHAGLKITLSVSGNYDSLNIRRLTSAEQTKQRPTPSPAPSPSMNDYDTEPFVFGGASRTGETTAVSTWYGRFFRSFRIQVFNSATPNSVPLFDSGIQNEYKSPIELKIKNLVCSRDLTEIATFYSGLDGKGKSTTIEQSAALSAVNILPNGQCVGYWTNGGVGKN